MTLVQPEVEASLPETTADIEYRIADSRADREAAFRLVYNSYLRAGLGDPNPWEMRVTPYHLLPTTEVYNAVYDGQVIFTVSLVLDGQLGLPMECIYGDEIRALRDQGLLLGEVSCLADRRSQFRSLFPVFLRTCRLMVQAGRCRGLDALVVAVHPRHARFYRRFMDFRVIGGEKTYPAVRCRPAVALWLEFARIDRENPENYHTFFGEQLPYEQLEPCPIQPWDCDHFRQMIDPGFHMAPLGSEDDFARRDVAEVGAEMAMA